MRFIMEIFASFSPEIELLLSYFSLLIMTYFSFLPLGKNNKNTNYQSLAPSVIQNNLFTYIDTKGNINKPLHADYLNNKMKSIRK